MFNHSYVPGPEMVSGTMHCVRNSGNEGWIRLIKDSNEPRKLCNLQNMQFKEIIGQDKAKETIRTMVSEQRLPHALILKGQPGIGKLAFPNPIAQFINCENPSDGESCGVCASCVKIRKGIHPDVRFVLPTVSAPGTGPKTVTDDFFPLFREQFFKKPYFSMTNWVALMQGENKQLGIRIHEIRELKRKMQLKAFEATYKVVIIWNAEKINREAANAMLKLLEEPPERTVMIMTVSDTTQLLTTINSRCQRVQLHRIQPEIMEQYLIDNYKLSPDRSQQVTQLSEGSVTKAIDLVNDANKSLSELYMHWMRVAMKGQFALIQEWVETVTKENKEFQKLFLSYAIQKIRDSLLFSFDIPQLATATKEEIEFQKKFSRYIQLNGIDKLARLLEDGLHFISRNANSQMVLTVLSLRIHSLLNGKVLI